MYINLSPEIRPGHIGAGCTQENSNKNVIPNVTFTVDFSDLYGVEKNTRTFFNPKREVFDSNFLLFLKDGTGFLVFVFLAQTVDNNNQLLWREEAGDKNSPPIP